MKVLWKCIGGLLAFAIIARQRYLDGVWEWPGVLMQRWFWHDSLPISLALVGIALWILSLATLLAYWLINPKIFARGEPAPALFIFLQLLTMVVIGTCSVTFLISQSMDFFHL